MASDLVTIASFLTTTEAELVQGVLMGEGIASYLECGYLVGGFDVLSNAVGGVKLQVASEDVERAAAILSAAKEAAKSEHSEYFDDDEVLVTDAGDAMAARAMRIAIIGMVLCPPLPHFYSAWILTELSLSHAPLSQSGSRKFYTALTIDLVAGSLFCLLWGFIFR